MFTDTLLAGTASQRGHKFAQVFATSYGWSRTITMTNKSDAPFSLVRVIRYEGVPPEIIMDGSKEQNLGDFARKLRNYGCHRNQIEPHSPWMNLCEGEIRELKRGSTRKMLKRNVPKKLWDHCLELESRIRSDTTLPRFDLDHHNPETKIHGMSSDISDICEFEFYEWVMFNDSRAPFRENKFHVGRWLGPAVDVGSALTYKILKSNGQ